MKVLHCPDLVGGNAVQLTKSERELELESRLIAFQQNYLNYSADEILLSDSAGILCRELARWKLFWRSLDYDVIHYNCGQSIMPSRTALYGTKARAYPRWLQQLYQIYVICFELFDVRVLKWLGKAIVVTYQGDDARQGDYCREHFDVTFANEVGEDYYPPELDRAKRRRIADFAKYADRIYALNPDLLHVLPSKAKFLPYANVDLENWRPMTKVNGKPLILHAPSHRGVKGTHYILEAVNRLHLEGVQFDFVLIEGMSNQEARTFYERADLLVDQLLAGWYGGLAVELMALGKPVMAYIRDGDLNFIPNKMRTDLPIIRVTSDSIYRDLKYWLTTGKPELATIGIRSRSFVEQWHNPVRIACRLKGEYEAILHEIALRRMK